MKNIGFDAVFNDNMTYDAICDAIETTNMPTIVSGNFSKFSNVQGHITCAVGFNKINQSLIVNDPYGDAYSGYTKTYGAKVEYKFADFYNKTFNKQLQKYTTWCLTFVKI